jgi:predicted ATP-grasp superfamily ATP-dependent carboligase
LVADFFGDEDMQAVARISVKIGGDLSAGLDEADLLESLGRLTSGRDCEGLVYGSGFEDRPNLLARLAQNWPLIGNDAATVERAKNPFALAMACSKLGIPHPEICPSCPADAHDWLRKRVGGAGGTHVRSALGAIPDGSEHGYYFQRHVAGRPVSALLLANGTEALAVGFSAQWTDPSEDRSARYGGAVRPAGISRRLKRQLAEAACALSSVLGLRGLNSVDFVVGSEEFCLIEVNPRPGATLDVFDSAATPLFALHVEACRGRLPARVSRPSGGAAAAIVYATGPIPKMPSLDWPGWCADLQAAGSSLRSGDPICTVRARASSSARAKALAMKRGLAVLAMAQGP